MRSQVVLALVLSTAAGVVAADEYVLPIFALGWPGVDGNRWSSEVFLVNPGPTTARVSNARFVPGTLKVAVPCYPPIAAFHEVPPYSTVMLSSSQLSLELQCPNAVLGGLAFDADAPVRITSRVVNVQGGAPTASALAGLGQAVPAFGASDLAVPGVVYQLPALVWDPYRCVRPPLFEVYLYLANPGRDAADVTLQQTRGGRPGELIVNGVREATPYTFTLQPQGWRQMKIELGGVIPAVCLPPQVTDLFFTTSGAIAAVASVVDRTSQDPRTVLPVRTDD